MEVNGDSWSLGLKFVVHAINTSVAETTGKTPYEVVFGQSARSNLAELEGLSKQGLLDENNFETDPNILEDETNTQFLADEADTDFLAEETHTNILAEETPIMSDHISGACFSDQENQSEQLSSNYILQYQGFIVAKGTLIKNRSVIHGHEFNIQSHSIKQITEVVDADFIPEDGNPFGETMTEGQYVLWKNEELFSQECSGLHEGIRKSARENYLKTAQKQQTKYDNKCATLRKKYNKDDLVGIPIHTADRTHTDKNIMPCKVLEVINEKNRTIHYIVFTEYGIIEQKFTSEDLVDLRNSFYPALSETDPHNLQRITFVKASRKASKWTIKGRTVCGCIGSCINNRCNCKKNGLSCSTKCHPTSNTCQNKI